MLKKILYVDDELINLELFRISFIKHYNVITVLSAEDGLRILENDPDIHMIITDLKMPGMNGLEFIKKIKEKDDHRICMLLTGYIESDVILEGFNRELIFRYLLKPWRKKDLMEVIEEGFNRLTSR